MRSLGNDLEADILAPIIGTGIFRASFLFGPASKQTRQNDPRLGQPDNDVAALGFDFHPFAVP